MNETIQQLLWELRKELVQLYGKRLVKLVLYGSYARGEANADSDVDIMVVLKAPVNSPLEILTMADITTDLSLKYGELISILPISDVDFAQRQTPFLHFVHQEAVLICQMRWRAC